MKVLHICTQAPGRKNGGEIGTFQFTYSLTKIADTVDYVGPRILDEDISKMYSDLMYLEGKINLGQKIFSVLHLFFDANYVLWLHTKIDFNQYDLIFVEFTKFSYIIKSIIGSGYRGKVIVRAHNVEYDFYKVNFQSNKNLVTLLKYITSKSREKYMLSNADIVFAITENDKKRIIDLYRIDPSKIVLCPVGVNEMGQNCTQKIPHNTKLRGLITGTLWFGPNADATAWFVNKVYPSVRDICDLTIAGFRPNDDLKRLCIEAGAKIVDTPEKMEPFFESADIVLAPIFKGGGMKVKIAEALSYGLPVVTTIHGQIGYKINNGRNGFVADTPEEFSKMIRQYYSYSEEQKTKFLEEVWKLYSENYSLEAIKCLCKKHITSLLDSN